MREPVTISLGGTDYAIRPLTLGQVRDIEHVIAEHEGQKGSATDLCIGVIKVGLKREMPNLVVEDLECTPQEAVAAMNDVLRAGGFRPDKPAGEAEADPVPSTGSASAAA